MLEDHANDLLDGLALGLGLVGQDHAVAEDVGRDGLDVLGRDVAAAAQEGVGAGGLEERNRGPRRGAEEEASVLPRVLGEADDVAEDLLFDVTDHLSPGTWWYVGDVAWRGTFEVGSWWLYDWANIDGAWDGGEPSTVTVSWHIDRWQLA